MMHQRIVHLIAGGVTLVVLFAAAQAQAAPTARDPAAAEALFRAALEARDKGDWGTACTKFNAGMDLDPTASTLINIAKCHEHEGKPATAWADLHRALVLNRETPGAQRKAELDDYVNNLLAKLEPRLPKLKIIIHQKPSGLEVTRNGLDVSTVVGEVLPVDPGAHEIEAAARGYVTEKRTVQIAEKQTVTVELSLVKDVTSRRRVGAYFAGGVGIAGMVVGGVTGALVFGKKGVIDANCGTGAGFLDENACKSMGFQAASDAATLGMVSTISSGVGAAGVATAAILLLTEPKRSAVALQRFYPWVLPAGHNGAMFGIRGDW